MRILGTGSTLTMTNTEDAAQPLSLYAVSYTHLDVYKRQVLILHVGGHIGDLVGDAAGGPVHPAEGGLDEAVFIDPGIGGQRCV